MAIAYTEACYTVKDDLYMIYKVFSRLKMYLHRLKVVYKAYKSEYKYSLSDYCQYLLYAEYPGSLKDFPEIKEITIKSDYTQLSINNQIYFWPKGANWKGLDWIYQEVFMPPLKNFHAYEFEGARLKPNGLVIDAGASEGFFTRYVLERGAKVIVFEPVASLVGALKMTFDEEIANKLVSVLPYALGATSRTAKLKTAEDHLFNSYLSNNGIEIKIVALDDIINHETVDFIKMDIEGSEMDAIEGARETISKYKPRLSIAVYHQVENANKVCALLRQIRPDYQIKYRGIYAWEGCEPRPFMVYAW